MKQNKVISLADYKESRLAHEKAAGPVSVEKRLPQKDRLWELLDRNIDLSVWQNRR